MVFSHGYSLGHSHNIKINWIILTHSVSNKRKYLIAFWTWIVNSHILECTLPPRRLKAYKRLFKFLSVFRFAGISWPLFHTVALLSVRFCTDCIFKETEKWPVSLYLGLLGSVWIGKERRGLVKRGEWKDCCPAHAMGAKAFPRKLQGTHALATKHGLRHP